MNRTYDKLKRIIDEFGLSSMLSESLSEEYDFNELLLVRDKISSLYEEKLNKDIIDGKLDIRKKEIALDVLEKHLDNIIKNN